MSDYSESIEYGRTEPVSSSVVDDTSSPRMKGEPLSERQFHDHFTVSVPWSPVRSPRARVVRLADIDEDRPLPLSETPTQPERSLPAREMRMQSREAAAESKFHQLHEAQLDAKLDAQPNQPKTRTDITARLRVLESLAGLREIDEEASSGSQPANEEANNRSAEASSSSSIDRNHSDESSDPSSIDRNHSDESSDPSSIDSSSSNESNSSSSNDEDDDDDVNEQVTYFFTVLCICFSFLCVIVTW